MDGEIGTADSGIVITYGFPGAAATTLDRERRLERRAALTPEDVERALTGVIADLSGLAVNEVLFRHRHPAESPDAAQVHLKEEIADASPDHRSFIVLFSGREVTAGTVLPRALNALGGLPVRWLTAEGGGLTDPVTVAELKLAEPAKFGVAFAGGRRAETFEAELRARICTSPPRATT